MADELTAKLARAGTQARAIVLAGHPRAFCAGANLSSSQTFGDGTDFDAGVRLETSFNPMMVAMKICPVPVVSAVIGAAAGVKASLALAADMIVAGHGAYIVQAFQRVVLCPMAAARFSRPRD